MANSYNEYFKSIADAIRERFNTTDVIWLSEFANRIDKDFPVTPITESDTFQSYIDKVLGDTARAIRKNGNTTQLILGKDIPNAIRSMKAVSYGELQYWGVQQVGWNYGTVPSVPSVSISQKVYTLTWEYYASNNAYDKFKIHSVYIGADWSNTSIYNPSSNVIIKPTEGAEINKMEIKCRLEKRIDLSGLIDAMQSMGAPEGEILGEMQSELNSQISSVNQLAGTFSFSIGYYPGTYS